MSKNNGIFDGLKGKQRPFLRAYLDETNPETYLNALASAKAAKYKAKNDNSFGAIGCENLKKLNSRIEKWLDEEGLSAKRLKLKLLSLIEAKQTHFHKVKGHVKPEDLPPGVIVIAESNKIALSGKGDDAEPFDDGDTIVAIPTDALETQRRSLDMALKVRGEYAPEKREHTGKGGGPIEHDYKIVDMPPTFKTIDEWVEWRKRSIEAQQQKETGVT